MEGLTAYPAMRYTLNRFGKDRRILRWGYIDIQVLNHLSQPVDLVLILVDKRIGDAFLFGAACAPNTVYITFVIQGAS